MQKSTADIVEQVRQLHNSPTRLHSILKLLAAAEATPQTLQAALSCLSKEEEIKVADELNLKPYRLRYWASGIYPSARLAPTPENCKQAIELVITRLAEQLPHPPEGL